MSESAVSTIVDRDEVEQAKKSTRLNVADGMPKYRAHKIIQALKIDEGRITTSGTLLIPANRDYDPFIVTRAFSSKHMPGGGGYFVRYKDGYESFSPAEAFEDGYTALEDGLEEDSTASEILAKVKADLAESNAKVIALEKSAPKVAEALRKAEFRIEELTEKNDELVRINLDVNEELAKSNSDPKVAEEAVKSLTAASAFKEQVPDEEIVVDDTPDSDSEIEVVPAVAKKSAPKKAPDNRKQ